MLERLLLATVIAATSLPAAACDPSEAAPLLPTPARRDGGPGLIPDAGVPVDAGATADARAIDAGLPDAGVRRRRPAPRVLIDAGVSDAGVPSDAAVADAPPADAGVLDGPLVDAAGDAKVLDPPVDAAPPVDAIDVLRDSGEAPPLYDARILGMP